MKILKIQINLMIQLSKVRLMMITMIKIIMKRITRQHRKVVLRMKVSKRELEERKLMKKRLHGRSKKNLKKY